ncbi:WhiB family transcriptional regulator [Herbidospora sp. NEAU-GS84]|uniref:WhiB family transcriptional regulator n=1 Tax=Herbidospora solisilvae TaxID=2696284 RepID=A0A7C9JFX9_9ACTN|nr:WhiB family transcriptional regulator [Herbidospora solisilvae]NAS23923.1 WhiB family transcriptional regulator [Herbidospora solisilvae]
MTRPTTGAPLPVIRSHPALRLLDELTDELPTEVADSAACADPELHTGPDPDVGESPQEREAREDVAKSVCAECPVRLRCLATALILRPEVGIWAGLTAQELAALSRPAVAS